MIFRCVLYVGGFLQGANYGVFDRILSLEMELENREILFRFVWPIRVLNFVLSQVYFFVNPMIRMCSMKTTLIFQ